MVNKSLSCGIKNFSILRWNKNIVQLLLLDHPKPEKLFLGAGLDVPQADDLGVVELWGLDRCKGSEPWLSANITS